MVSFDPKEAVDSVVDGVLSAVGFFPNVAENIARNATDYATAVRRDLEDIKTSMPDRPEVLPRVAFGIIGQTIGAGVGMVEAVATGIDKTAKDIKSQTRRVIG